MKLTLPGMPVYQYASIGDFVWVDANANGVQDSGRTRYQPVLSVTLLDGAGTFSRNCYYKWSWCVIASQIWYQVHTAIQFTLACRIYTLSPQDAGGDDSVDSDPDLGNRQPNSIYNPKFW